jgi:transcriptional regulator with XRE-family HTH domain
MRRKLLKKSQTQLAEDLGVTFQQVQKYEKGTNRIGSSRLQQIAVSLKVPIAFFFEGQSGDSKASMPNLSEFQATLAAIAGTITDPSKQRLVLATARAVAGSK